MNKIRLLIIILLSITSLVAQAELTRTNNDMTVIDTETKLEWQDSYENNTIPNDEWHKSISYCEELILDGKDDWRLPNINELKSIIVDTQYEPTLIIGNNGFKFTENTESSIYWSSTQRLSSVVPRYKWGVSFRYGWVSNFETIGSYRKSGYIRCVR